MNAKAKDAASHHAVSIAAQRLADAFGGPVMVLALTGHVDTESVKDVLAETSVRGDASSNDLFFMTSVALHQLQGRAEADIARCACEGCTHRLSLINAAIEALGVHLHDNLNPPPSSAIQ